jgi:hypothetical protein
VFLTIHASITKRANHLSLILAIVLIEAALEFLNDSLVVGVVASHAFCEALHEVKETKLTDDRGPKDEFEEVEQFWERIA